MNQISYIHMAAIYKTRIKIENEIPPLEVRYELNHIYSAVSIGLGVPT